MIVLDTHAWIRWLHPEIGRPFPGAMRSWLDNVADHVAVSVISCLEIAQLVKRGTLVLPLPLPDWYEEALAGSDVQCLPVTPVLLHASTRLPDLHRDPADRIIIATTQAHDAILITADRTIQQYPGLRCSWDAPP